MGSSFDRWEKDPFFSAAEEVQESADRMESTYRTWIHAKKDTSSTWNDEQLRRDMQTVLGTTKWQLDEFARAVQSSYANHSNEDAKDMHREFIVAIEDQISKVEKSLQESAHSDGKASQPWMRLDEGECNEFALFLSGPSASNDKTVRKNNFMDCEMPQETDKESVADCTAADCTGDTNNLVEVGSLETSKDKRSNGHRRTASASADISSWQIAISEDGHLQSSSNDEPQRPPRKTPSVSGFLNSMEYASKLKWPKNGLRKWKAVDCQHESDTALLRPPLPTRVITGCYEKSKNCLGCDDCYNNKLYGWYGAIHRQLQRSQYQMQYSRPVQVTFWILLICVIVFVVLCAI